MIKKLLAAVLALFAAAAFAGVDANTATQAELDSVKGIGAGISSKIIEERKKAPFKDWQDMITRVKGVGEHNSAKFSSAGLTVNGAAFAGAPATPAATAKKDDKKAAAPAASAKAEVPAAAASTAAETKAAKKKEREEKKAAKTAAADEAKKGDKKSADKSDKGAKESKPAAAASAAASGAKK